MLKGPVHREGQVLGVDCGVPLIQVAAEAVRFFPSPGGRERGRKTRTLCCALPVQAVGAREARAVARTSRFGRQTGSPRVVGGRTSAPRVRKGCPVVLLPSSRF